VPPKALFRTLNRIHIFLYRASGGRILGKIVGSPVLLLTTTGRKTGKARTVPIVHLRDGQNFVVIASDAPAWHKNLKGSAQAIVEVKGQTHTVAARDIHGDEAETLWAKFIQQSPAFKNFQGHDNHQLVMLAPINEQPSGAH
jgi:deazaflavin-dependent oxidoreductase (nitroreductase family)